MTIKTSLTTEVLAILCILWGSLFLTRCAASYETDQVCRSGENNECQDRNDENGRVEHGDDEECTLYIAESTIPNAGLGTFTTIPRRIGDLVGMSELCIPYVHFGYSGGTDPFLDYVWNGMTLGMFREHLYHGHLEAFCAGLGSVVNSHSALINAARPRPKYDPFLVRQVHPGAGALTPYHNATSTIVRDIPAGAELFKDYGDNWFHQRTPQIGYVALTLHYEYTDKLIKKLYGIAMQHSNEELYEELYNLCIAIRDIFQKARILNGFPPTFNQALVAAQQSISAAHQLDHIRSNEWLQTHGRCVDTIVSKDSTIPGAGRGAFAKTTIQQGQVVITSPVLHAPQTAHDFMAKVKVTDDAELQKRLFHWDKVESYQLLLNYCFGHAESSLLLCPNGGGVGLINHAKNGVANVRVQWAQDISAHRHDMVHNATLEDLEQVHTSVFLFEFVALRDIDKGEEILMDYGDDWERAWQSHQEWWQLSGIRDTPYFSAIEMNQKLRDAVIRTTLEQEKDPYPSNVEIRCHPNVVKNNTWHYTWTTQHHGHLCRVLDRYPTDGGSDWLYLVDVEVWPFEYVMFRPPEKRQAYVGQLTRGRVPRRALRFFDVPGSTDLHMTSAFRHWIGVPDDIFPDQWRNNK